MVRKIIKIEESKCNGCGLCIDACHEGAIKLINNKAVLISDSYCDGLGNCLPVCPTDAITIEEREAEEFNEEAVNKNIANKNNVGDIGNSSHCQCPGDNAKIINKKASINSSANGDICDKNDNEEIEQASHLMQWPCQLKLVPVNAPYFNGADLLIAADCTAFAYGGFHSRFMKDKISLIACPKLDNVDYSEKLYQIIKLNNIKSITVARMSVPCCGGIVNYVKEALEKSGKTIPLDIETINTDGSI